MNNNNYTNENMLPVDNLHALPNRASWDKTAGGKYPNLDNPWALGSCSPTSPASPSKLKFAKEYRLNNLLNTPRNRSNMSITLVSPSPSQERFSETTLSLLPLSSKSTQCKNSAKPNYGNDYSSYYVKRGKLPQCWIRNIEVPFDGYPKLQELHYLKSKHYMKHAAPPVGIRCEEQQISSKIQSMHSEGCHFDVVMVGGCMDSCSYKQLQSLRLELITPRPSLLFLWVPSSEIARGRLLMESWGFRRGEDITYVVTSKNSVHWPKPDPLAKKSTIFTPSTWHCLMGLKGTMRRSTDTELINCNIDTDVIIEKPNQAANVVPEDIYSIVENFTNMARKIHIVPTSTPTYLPVRPRKGWVVMSPDAFDVGTFDPAYYRQRKLIPVNAEVEVIRPQTPPSLR